MFGDCLNWLGEVRCVLLCWSPFIGGSLQVVCAWPCMGRKCVSLVWVYIGCPVVYIWVPVFCSVKWDYKGKQGNIKEKDQQCISWSVRSCLWDLVLFDPE